MNDDSTGDTYSDEVIADDEPSANLRALMAEAQALERETAPAVPGAPTPAPPVNNAAELLVALTMARDLSLPILPRDKGDKLKDVWSDPTLERVSAAGAAVMDLHGLSMSGLLGKYGAYLILLAALAGPVVQTRAVLLEAPARREAPAE